jgi:acid-sensing ion channel, other
LCRTETELHYERNISLNRAGGLKTIPDRYFPLTINTYQNPVFSMHIMKPEIPMSYEVCRKVSIFVHSSDFLPTFSGREDFYGIDYGRNIEVEVTPEIIKTDRSLAKLDPEMRECYFDNERSLRFFRAYTQKNCEIECFTNYTIQRCGCVALDQPYSISHNITLCHYRSFHDSICCMHVRTELQMQENFSIERNCSCYPTCDSISFHTKYRYTKINTNETTIAVRMNTDDIVLYRRYQQFTFSDIVSYVGGLLGLFAGISMLSIVELFYFFSLRLCGSLYQYFYK